MAGFRRGRKQRDQLKLVSLAQKDLGLDRCQRCQPSGTCLTPTHHDILTGCATGQRRHRREHAPQSGRDSNANDWNLAWLKPAADGDFPAIIADLRPI